jgi:hypothetical protein
MRSCTILLTIIVSTCLTTAAWAQKTLSSAETQQILQQLTSQPRNAWVPAGTIQATHQEYGAAKTTDAAVIRSEIDKAVQEYQNNANKREKTAAVQKAALDAIPFNVRYKLSNEYSMGSRVTARYDNGRFYWEINVDSRQDSVQPDATLAGNSMTRQFNMGWNKRRIFAWDGQKYTTYSASGNRATVDAAGKLQRAVNGPLTAGLIPWGNNRYSLASLTAAKVSAKQNAAGMVEMTLAYTDGCSTSVTLDPAKAYAVTKATMTSAGGAVAIYTCSGYRLVGGNWVPSTVTIERQNDNPESRAATSEQWTFTSVSAAAPAAGSFTVPLGVNALVEYASPVTASMAVYIQSDLADTDELLAQHLAYAAAKGARTQNCATAALGQVASGFGKSPSGSALAGLVGANGCTTLYDMKRLAQSQGLFCRVVKTDLAALASLQGAKAILHIPGRNHLVVLDRVDDRYVWLIDLSNKKFYYRQSVDFFPMEWSEGTALLLSDRPIAAQSNELGDTRLKDTLGGTGWACNDMFQESDWGYCIYGLRGCGGSFTYYYQRWGCGPVTSGSCYNELMVLLQESPCIDDPIYDCTITGEWYYGYCGACA